MIDYHKVTICCASHHAADQTQFNNRCNHLRKIQLFTNNKTLGNKDSRSGSIYNPTKSHKEVLGLGLNLA